MFIESTRDKTEEEISGPPRLLGNAESPHKGEISNNRKFYLEILLTKTRRHMYNIKG